MRACPPPPVCFSFHPPATTELYTLSLHDALPILRRLLFARQAGLSLLVGSAAAARCDRSHRPCSRASSEDRKSTRLNSSHVSTSYAVFCLKKKTAPRQPCTTLTSACSAHRWTNGP